MSNLNRRDFLKLAGKVSLGAAALTAVPAVVSAEEKYVTPAWPWKYEKLDVAEVQASVFEHFSTDGGCAAGAVGGILAVLAKNYPEGPYALLNSKIETTNEQISAYSQLIADTQDELDASESRLR